MSCSQHTYDRLFKLGVGVDTYQDTLDGLLKNVETELSEYSREYRNDLFNEVVSTSYYFGFKALLNLHRLMTDQTNNYSFQERIDELNDAKLTKMYEDLCNKVNNAILDIQVKYQKSPQNNSDVWPDDQKKIFHSLEKFCEDKEYGMDKNYIIGLNNDENPDDTEVKLITDLQDAVRKAYIKYTVEEIISYLS